MKLRILDNSIRLRLDRSELRDLLRDGVVERRVVFGSSTAFVYALHTAAQELLLSATVGASRIDIYVDSKRAIEWAGSDEVGVAATQASADGALQLVVEKDFPCRHSGTQSASDKFTASTMNVDAEP